MTDAGVKLERYNSPLSLKFFRFMHRTHRKLMVVDGKVGFIAASACRTTGAVMLNWASGVTRITVVEGPVVSQMQAVFKKNWLTTHSNGFAWQEYFPETTTRGFDDRAMFASGPHDKAEQARLSYLLAMAASRKNIRLAHAYLSRASWRSKRFSRSRKRGVKVENHRSRQD